MSGFEFEMSLYVEILPIIIIIILSALQIHFTKKIKNNLPNTVKVISYLIGSLFLLQPFLYYILGSYEKILNISLYLLPLSLIILSIILIIKINEVNNNIDGLYILKIISYIISIINFLLFFIILKFHDKVYNHFTGLL